MNRESVYEEFYGASMESEIIGQEFLAETISIGAIALASWGVYRFFKDAIKAVRTKINESSKIIMMERDLQLYVLIKTI